MNIWPLPDPIRHDGLLNTALHDAASKITPADPSPKEGIHGTADHLTPIHA